MTAPAIAKEAPKKASLLPTEKTKPEFRISGQSILIYGQAKIGKTTFASEIPGVLFLATEKGIGFVEAHSVVVDSYKKFMDTMAEVSKGGHTFQCLCIDTIDNLVKMFALQLCERHGVQHVSFDKLGWGVGTDIIAAEISRVLLKITNELHLGLVLISHSTTKDYKQPNGEKETKIIPTLPEKVREVVTGHCDHILYAEIRNRLVDGKMAPHRVIRTVASREYDAGSRLKGLPDPLDLKYEAFEKAIAQAQKKAQEAQAT